MEEQKPAGHQPLMVENENYSAGWGWTRQKKKKLNCLRKKNVDEELLHVDAATYVNKHVYIV